MAFHKDFCAELSQLAATIQGATPLLDSPAMKDFLDYYEQSSPEAQEAIRRDVEIVAARLIQIDRMLQAHTPLQVD